MVLLLLKDDVPVIMFLVADGNEDKSISNLQELIRGAKIILIADKKCIEKATFAHLKIEIPNFETISVFIISIFNGYTSSVDNIMLLMKKY